MTSSRFRRSPLGAFYRSPLGVRGDITFRVIVVRQPGFAEQVDLDLDPYRDLAKSLKAPFVASTAWLPELTIELKSKRKRVRNLVFFIGGGSPVNGHYFKNYIYAPGAGYGPAGGPYGGQSCQRTSFYTTNYYPGNFDAVKKEAFDEDYEEFLDELPNWHEAPAYFFLITGSQSGRAYAPFNPLDPASIHVSYVAHPEGPGIQVTLRGTEYHSIWDLNERTFEEHGVHSPAFQAEQIWCLHVQAENGILKEYWQRKHERNPRYIFPSPSQDPPWDLYPTVPTSETLVFNEGVDRSHDSRAVTVSLIKDMVKQYGPSNGKSSFKWRYLGEINPENELTKDKILHRLRHGEPQGH